VTTGPFALREGTATLFAADLGGQGGPVAAGGDGVGHADRRWAAVVSRAVDRHGGVGLAGFGDGDSFVASFAHAPDAIACALGAQRELDGQGLPSLRVGLHSGEAQLGAGVGHSSPAVARATRLRDVGHAGQVLVSQACAALVAGHLPAGASLVDLGMHRLRDLGRPEQVYQLCHPELQARFPPLRSLERYRHNLAVQLTSFVGREAAMAVLGQLLADHGLVTLTGSGGCGKTRLALQVAAEALGARASEAWFVDLSGLADPTLVPGALMTAMGVQEVPGQAHTDTLTAQLTDRDALIVLDNCEHVLAGASALAVALVRTCGRLAVLATSRQPLGVAGEVVWRVPCLSVPEGGVTLSSLRASEAARLFRDRAQAARPGFALSAGNASAVASICQRLDGIPLAVELAAARVSMMSVELLAEALADGFPLLGGGTSPAMPRHATLRASVDWSYGLLPEPERALLRRLSVFAGGFSLEAAEHVGAAGGTGRDEVLPFLSSLVDKSLVQVNDEGDRYRMLETIRAYAAEGLAVSGEDVATRDRHLFFYLQLGERADNGMRTSAAASWLRVLGTEQDNLRAALDWAVASGQAGTGARLLCAIGQFLHVRCHWREGRRRCEELLAHDLAPAQRAGLYQWAASFSLASDPAACRSYGQALVDLGRELGDGVTVARGLARLGLGQQYFDPPAALGTLTDGLATARAAGDDATVVECLSSMAGANHILGRSSEALRCAEEALATAQRIGYRWGAGRAMMWLPGPAMELGQLDRAAGVAEASMALAQELESEILARGAYLCLGVIGIYLAKPSALADLAEARRLAERAHDDENLGDIRHWQGALALALGHEEEGRRLLEEALPLADAYRPICGARIRCLLAEAAVRRADLAGARRWLDEALAMPSPGPLATRARARLARAGEQHHLAWQLAEEGLGSSHRSGARLAVIEFLELLALLCVDDERYLEAGRLLGAAAAERRQTGYIRFVPDQADVDAATAKVEAMLGSPGLAAALSQGASISVDEVVAYLRRGRGRRGRPSAGWSSLTPTEQKVVELIGGGLSNAEIGERMFVSTATVKTHLHHIFGKLGVANRRQLARAGCSRDRLDKDLAPPRADATAPRK
jgi:predicted ATPase/class 3 adenylate cyclase/DNA-binding CsgD family transcriptional regulator